MLLIWKRIVYVDEIGGRDVPAVEAGFGEYEEINLQSQYCQHLLKIIALYSQPKFLARPSPQIPLDST